MSARLVDMPTNPQLVSIFINLDPNKYGAGNDVVTVTYANSTIPPVAHDQLLYELGQRDGRTSGKSFNYGVAHRAVAS